MKTNFLPKNNIRNNRSRIKLLYIVLLFAGLFIFSTIFGGGILSLTTPLYKHSGALGTAFSNSIESLRSKDSLIAENKALKEKIASQDELILSLRSIASSRDDLLASFGRPMALHIPAGVLIHPPETPYDILVIDAGANMGVVAGMSVSLPEGALLGTVTTVFSKTSRVRLFSTQGERTDAVLERGGIPVELKGKGGGNFSFSLPRSAPVEVGDRILSPGVGSTLVAIAGEVDAEPTDSFKSVLAASPINPTAIRFVQVNK